MSTPAATDPGRRAGLKGLTLVIWGGLVTSLGLGLGAVLRLISSGGSPPPAPVDLTAADLPPEGGVHSQDGVALARDARGLFALSLVCPHLGCRPAWSPGERRFLCPCHGSSFALDGARLAGPARKGLTHLALSPLAGGGLRVFPDRPVADGTRLAAGGLS